MLKLQTRPRAQREHTQPMEIAISPEIAELQERAENLAQAGSAAIRDALSNNSQNFLEQRRQRGGE